MISIVSILYCTYFLIFLLHSPILYLHRIIYYPIISSYNPPLTTLQSQSIGRGREYLMKFENYLSVDAMVREGQHSIFSSSGVWG